MVGSGGGKCPSKSIAVERRGGVDQSLCSRRGSELLDHMFFYFCLFFNFILRMLISALRRKAYLLTICIPQVWPEILLLQ